MALNKPLESVTENDLQELLGKVPEEKTIEYKLLLPGNSESQRKEFLADVSSFANAAGGDLIYGIRTEAGVPIEVCGLREIDLDAKKLELENVIRDGIRPRIPGVGIRGILLTSGVAIIIRIPKSWASPHMVIFGKHDRFYSRNSAGKFRLDVDELRSAFLISETRAERMRNFRTDRLGKIIAGEVPITSDGPERVVLHIAPLGAFDPGASVDLSILSQDPGAGIEPISAISPGYSLMINFDGILTYSREARATAPCSYVQVFRNGIIEAVDAYFLSRGRSQRLISAVYFEKTLLGILRAYLLAQKRLGVQPPVFVMLNLLGMVGYSMYVPPEKYYPRGHPIDRDALILPEILIENFDCDLPHLMKPAFDQIWNAAGWPGSIGYDEAGKRIEQ